MILRNDTLALPKPPLQALRTTQRRFAMHVGKAWKYPRAMAPFGAIEDNSEQATEELFSLMGPEEVVYVPSEMPLRLPGLHCEGPVDVLQFTYPQERALPRIVEGRGAVIERLSCADAQAMVGLTDVAFPGFFRRRTCEMGRYYGIRDSRQLVAMCGERMNMGRFREISGLCTHPEARGQGYATLLMARLLQEITRRRTSGRSCMWRPKIQMRSPCMSGWDSSVKALIRCSG